MTWDQMGVMTTTLPTLQETLEQEGKAHIARHGAPVDGLGRHEVDDFFVRLAQVWSEQPLSEEWTAAEMVPIFSVMHGYLEDAYIGGYSDKKQPWAHSRQGSWNRWIEYLVEVDGFGDDDARSFAKKFFYAVDSIAAYT